VGSKELRCLSILHSPSSAVVCYGGWIACYKDGRSLLSFDLPEESLKVEREALDRPVPFYLYASVGTPPAHNSGIYDAAPPLRVRDLRLGSNNLLVPRALPKPTIIRS